MRARFMAFLEKYREMIVYMIFGGLTTVFNILIYWPCVNWLALSATVSDIIAWIGSVLFAFLTNKPFVFKSHDWSGKVLLPEFAKFVSCRLASGVLEIVFIFVTVDMLQLHAMVMKLIVSVVVVIVNYVGSKLLVFRKNQ